MFVIIVTVVVIVVLLNWGMPSLLKKEKKKKKEDHTPIQHIHISNTFTYLTTYSHCSIMYPIVSAQVNTLMSQFGTLGEHMETTPKDAMLVNIRDAAALLIEAGGIAQRANALASSVPVVRELTSIAQRLNAMMQEVNKLGGL